MALQKFLFNPGINKEGTDYTAEGGWFDGNLMRFRKGFPEKIGGWEKYLPDSFEGTGRKLHGWVTLDGTKLLGLGSYYYNLHLNVTIASFLFESSANLSRFQLLFERTREVTFDMIPT